MNNAFTYMKKVVTGQPVMPFSIELHPTDYCNHDCIWCIMEDRRKVGGNLSHSQLKSIALQSNEIKDIRNIFISGGGEPLLNDNLFLPYSHENKIYSNFFEMIHFFGISIGISTNGELLYKLIESGAYKYIDIVRISVDAGTENQYSKLHRSKKGFLLKDLIKVIEEYYRVSNKQVQISYLIHEINESSYHSLANSLKLTEAVSKIDIKTLMQPDKKFVAEYFGDDYKDTVINGIQIKFKRKKKDPKYNFSAITNILVDPCGKVYPCCHLTDDVNLIGNITETPLPELIYNNYNKLKEYNCKKCSYSEMNQLLNKFKVLGGEKYDKL